MSKWLWRDYMYTRNANRRPQPVRWESPISVQFKSNQSITHKVHSLFTSNNPQISSDLDENIIGRYRDRVTSDQSSKSQRTRKMMSRKAHKDQQPTGRVSTRFQQTPKTPQVIHNSPACTVLAVTVRSLETQSRRGNKQVAQRPPQ